MFISSVQSSNCKVSYRDSLVCAGHLTLGEKLDQKQRYAFRAAQKEAADIAVLVGDIEFPRKLQAYITKGIAGVSEIYRSESKSFTSLGSGFGADPFSLRAEYDDPADVIDESIYKKALAQISVGASTDVEMMSHFNWTGVHPAVNYLRSQFIDKIRKEIIPKVVAQQLKSLGVDINEVRIYSSWLLGSLTELKVSRSEDLSRGSASLRFSSFAPNVIGNTILPTDFGNYGVHSRLEGVSFALLERAAYEGYHRVIHICDKKHENLLENAKESYLAMREKFPDDPRWRLSIENRYY